MSTFLRWRGGPEVARTRRGPRSPMRERGPRVEEFASGSDCDDALTPGSESDRKVIGIAIVEIVVEVAKPGEGGKAAAGFDPEGTEGHPVAEDRRFADLAEAGGEDVQIRAFVGHGTVEGSMGVAEHRG